MDWPALLWALALLYLVAGIGVRVFSRWFDGPSAVTWEHPIEPLLALLWPIYLGSLVVLLTRRGLLRAVALAARWQIQRGARRLLERARELARSPSSGK